VFGPCADGAAAAARSDAAAVHLTEGPELHPSLFVPFYLMNQTHPKTFVIADDGMFRQ
jgi:hypothetical protein